MSRLAYDTFRASYMLTAEEELPENREEFTAFIEDTMQAHGIECDNKFKELPEETKRQVLEEARKLFANSKKRKKKQQQDMESEDKEEVEVIESSN
jgi:excinuclease UvrABC ATPase subunit